MRASKSIKALFVSQTRLKLIHAFFYFPHEIYYVRQLVRLVDEEINSVRRELTNLAEAGIVESEVRGNRLYYWANLASPLFDDLLKITHQTSGFGAKVIKSGPHLGKIKFLLYSQNFAHHGQRQNDSVDFIVVGDVLLKHLDPLVKAEEVRRGREINYMVMEKSELRLRLQRRDPIIVDFFLRVPVAIIGSNLELSQI